MFRKLHLQMTIFCTMVTGSIILILTVTCMLFAQNSIKKNEYTVFLQQLNYTLIHLQEQDIISHQWLNQIYENNQLKIYIYDNNVPLYYQSYHHTKQENRLKNKAIEIAETKYNINIFEAKTQHVITKTEFNFSAFGSEYYASAGIIPKKSSHLSYIILFPLQTQKKQIDYLHYIIGLINFCAIILMLIFSWFFTKRMIIPLENTRQKQMDFIASASHELRTPLSVIRTGLETLKKTNNHKMQEHFINLMFEESSHMQNLINDMLFLANSDSGNLPMHMSSCQPDSLLLNVFEKYEPLAYKKNISLSITLPEELLRDFICDKERITQVFSILLDNAISYTPKNGKIHIALEQKKTLLVFSFSDTGCGIPDKEKSHIFERFYRTDHSHTDKTHFGLGLCIAKEIITAHHGKIWVEDGVECGSCFYVAF